MVCGRLRRILTQKQFVYIFLSIGARSGSRGYPDVE
jgi:hypothetical protein